MNAVVSSTGFCILAFYQYPDLQNTIQELFNMENSLNIKIELLKLFGCLGAIDTFTHKKVIFDYIDHKSINILWTRYKNYFIRRFVLKRFKTLIQLS